MWCPNEAQSKCASPDLCRKALECGRVPCARPIMDKPGWLRRELEAAARYMKRLRKLEDRP